MLAQLKDSSIEWLSELIKRPSLSGAENLTADYLVEVLASFSIKAKRRENNVWAVAENHEPGAPVLLLNSHHDTVKAGANWTHDPFDATIVNGQLFGLGSNDAGASLVSLLAVFIYFYQQEQLPFKLVLAMTAEEENSGPKGIRFLLPHLGNVDLAIVGEPTEMQLAVAERGLMVLDGVAHGKTGHAARQEGENALYKAMDDINWLRNYQFEKTSDLLGPCKMTVTQIKAGYQHNVVPDICEFVVDIRSNENYKNQEILDLVRAHVKSEMTPRSTHLSSSALSLDHPVVKRGISMGLTTYGSPTLSDQALMPFPSLKMGPGKSQRSHTPDEFIEIKEIHEGIEIYIELLNDLKI